MRQLFLNIQRQLGTLLLLFAAVACGSGDGQNESEAQELDLSGVVGERFYETTGLRCGYTNEEILDSYRSSVNYVSFEGTNFVQVDTDFLSDGCRLETSSEIRKGEEDNYYLFNHEVELLGESCGSAQDEELLEFNRSVWDSLGEVKIRYERSGRVLRLTYVGNEGCIVYKSAR